MPNWRQKKRFGKVACSGRMQECLLLFSLGFPVNWDDALPISPTPVSLLRSEQRDGSYVGLGHAEQRSRPPSSLPAFLSCRRDEA